MRPQVFASTRRLLSQPSSLRLPVSCTTNTRGLATIRSASSASQHSSLCRCTSCSTRSLFLSRHSFSASRPSPFPVQTRAFSGDAHAEHSHGDFLDPHTVQTRVLAVLHNIDKLASATITAQSTWEQLGLDSLDEVEVVMALEEEFMVDLYDADAVRITSVKEAVEAFSNFPFAM